MVFREMVAVYSDIHMKHVMNPVGETQRVLIGTYTHHCLNVEG
jgi:hypothetical protein